MQSAQPNLLARDDTLLGVCQALGEDFGFNPQYLRAAFAVVLLWNPAVVVGTYLAAGMVVALSRWASPNPRPAVAAPSVAEPALQRADNESDPVALAA
jgi:phage shock protein PspC (stress-responsive transcriptional regulator)